MYACSSVCLRACLSVCLSLLHLLLSRYRPIRLKEYSSDSVSACLGIYTHVSFFLSLHLSLSSSVCLFVCLSICLTVCLFVCLSFCLLSGYCIVLHCIVLY